MKGVGYPDSDAITIDHLIAAIEAKRGPIAIDRVIEDDGEATAWAVRVGIVAVERKSLSEAVRAALDAFVTERTQP